MDFYEYMDKEIPNWKLCLDNDFVEKMRADYSYVTNIRIFVEQLYKELEQKDDDYTRESIKNANAAIQRHAEKFSEYVKIAKEKQKNVKKENLYEDAYKEAHDALEAMKRITGYREKYEKDHEEIKQEIELARQLTEEREKGKKL